MTGKHHRRAVIAVVNLKGGTTKTTTAVFLAHALHEQGRSVLLVDADPQASSLTWNETAAAVDGEGFPFAITGMPTRELHRQLLDVIGQRFDAVVIDTPPLEQKSGIVVSALRLATLVVVPVAPTPIEYERLAEVRQTVHDAADFSHDGEPVPLVVLLTRVIPQATSTAVYREQAERDGFVCLRSAVGRLERFAQAYGDRVENATGTAYGDAVKEFIERGYVA